MGNNWSNSRLWSDAGVRPRSPDQKEESDSPPQVHPLPKSLSGCIDACRGGVVVLAGCGGGCDVFGTALLLHSLRGVAKETIIVSLTHTDDDLIEEYGKSVTPYMYCVEPGTFPTPPPNTDAAPEEGGERAHLNMDADEEDTNRNRKRNFFPEAMFANAVGQPVYALSRHATVSQIVKAYRAVHRAHQSGETETLLRAVFLTDGGCDVLLTGDETGLATPAEDMLHLRAMMDVPAKHKAILALGVNVDCGHGVVQSELDDRLAELRKSGAMLFEQFLTLDREDAAYYYRVVAECNPAWTVTQSLVRAAIKGHRGYDYDVPSISFQIAGRSLVPLTDQTATLFGFDLHAVAVEVKYLSNLTPSSDMLSVCDAVQAHRAHRALTALSLLQDSERTQHIDDRVTSPPSTNPQPTSSSSIWLAGWKQNCGVSAKEFLESL